MKSIESGAKTIEDAISLGLEKLGLSIADVTIETLDEGAKGFLGLIGNKQARVRLTVKESADDEKPASVFADKSADNANPVQKLKEKAEKVKEQIKSEKHEAKSEAAREKKPRAQKPQAQEQPSDTAATEVEVIVWPEDTQEGKAQTFLSNVTRMMGVNVSVNVRRDEEGNIRVDMRGDTLGILIGRRGETLDALQYLTSLTVNKGRDEYTRVTLDNENYRAKREEALTRLANRMANRAVKTGRKVVMEPMNPYERRILHSALQANDAVDTHSEGDEPNRHVVITLKQEQE